MDKQTIEQHLKRVLENTDYKNIGTKKSGKVRDIYEQADKLILISTDRYSAFDRILALIPFKGQVLTQTAKFWFENTKDIVSNHILDIPDPNVVIAKKCTVLPIEMVVRGYITGVTGTALWTLYSKGKRNFGDFVLPDGMHKNQKLERPVITPTTKFEIHDRPLTAKDIQKEKMMERKQWEELCEIALKLFERGQKIALERDLILVDTKYEFGLDKSGRIILIDEIHTPDSSRYWQASSYREKIEAGLEPENFDKEFLRLWFKEHSDPYKDKVMPEAPADMVAELSFRYVSIFEQITGLKFETDLTTPILERIGENLKKYIV